MINALIPQHVFVSYSHNDKKYVEKIIADLRKADIDVWIDSTGLQPGTPNWNAAIREAIYYAFAVLLIASPNAGQSNIVQGEISLARSQGCPIYPLWIAGNEWVDCVPLDMMQIQYIDCRNRKYDSGLSQAITTLKEAIDLRLPKHRAVCQLLCKMTEFGCSLGASGIGSL